jgi:hypothetical protein
MRERGTPQMVNVLPLADHYSFFQQVPFSHALHGMELHYRTTGILSHDRYIRSALWSEVLNPTRMIDTLGRRETIMN